jgi:hypothetical protein
VSEREQRVRREQASVPRSDLDLLWELYGENRQAALPPGLLEGISLDPRENQRVLERREAEQEARVRALEEVSPGLKTELLSAPAPLAYPPPPPAPGRSYTLPPPS